jgi:excisionase family DNA binding protein
MTPGTVVNHETSTARMVIGDPRASARWRVWAALVAHPGATAGRLARVAVLGESTAGKALAEMEKAGVAVREQRRPPDPPHRRGRPPATWRASGRSAIPTIDLLTVAEVAGMWGVSKVTVYRMVRCGQLNTLRVGHSLRIPRAAVETCQQPKRGQFWLVTLRTWRRRRG